jgi:hypothetical protein
LSHTDRNSIEFWYIQKKLKNEPSIGAGAASIQPTLVPPLY